MKRLLYIICLLLIVTLKQVSAQNDAIEVDLSDNKAAQVEIDVDVEKFIILNRVKDITYSPEWAIKRKAPPVLVLPVASSSDEKHAALTCSKDVKDLMTALDSAIDEKAVKALVDRGNQILSTIADDECKTSLKERIDATKALIEFPYAGMLDYNMTISLTIRRVDKNNKQLSPLKYTFVTEEKSRWLTHFGLSYAPSVFSPGKRYFSKADADVASTYIITAQHNRDRSILENISPTLNFTYPFSNKFRGLDAGFTAGFGLNQALQLSAHSGLSALIGTNVIISSGIVLMQKYNLRGEYAESDIIKENLAFDSLHEKVWKPELYFTIGFRFDKNPFGNSSNSSNEASENEEEE